MLPWTDRTAGCWLCDCSNIQPCMCDCVFSVLYILSLNSSDRSLRWHCSYRWWLSQSVNEYWNAQLSTECRNILNNSVVSHSRQHLCYWLSFWIYFSPAIARWLCFCHVSLFMCCVCNDVCPDDLTMEEWCHTNNTDWLNILISSLLTITEIHIKTIKTQKYTKV